MRLLAIVLSFVLVATDALATETPWQNHQDMLRTRLVVASHDAAMAAPKGDGDLLLAWEAELAPGWKTYWRSPGEAGLPVRINHGGKAIDIYYPLPERFELFGLETYGYSNRVLMPFRINSSDRASAVEADFMVCKEICVPFRTTYSLDAVPLMPAFSKHDIRVGTWLKQVPDREEDAGAGLAILSARVVGPVGHQRLIVDAKADKGLAGADLLAEAGDMFHFGSPQMKLLGDGTRVRFVLAAMTGKKSENLKGGSVRLTFSDGRGHAIDTTVPLAAN